MISEIAGLEELENLEELYLSFNRIENITCLNKLVIFFLYLTFTYNYLIEET